MTLMYEARSLQNSRSKQSTFDYLSLIESHTDVLSSNHASHQSFAFLGADLVDQRDVQDHTMSADKLENYNSVLTNRRGLEDRFMYGLDGTLPGQALTHGFFIPNELYPSTRHVFQISAELLASSIKDDFLGLSLELFCEFGFIFC